MLASILLPPLFIIISLTIIAVKSWKIWRNVRGMKPNTALDIFIAIIVPVILIAIAIFIAGFF